MKTYKPQILLILFALSFSSIISQEWPTKQNTNLLDNELSFGPVNNFSAGQAAFMATDTISSNKIIIVYRDWDNSGYGTAVIGTVENMETSYEIPVVFAATNVFLPKVKVLNDSVFLVVYRDMGQGGKGMVIKGEIENDDLVFGSPVIFSETMISSSSIIFMNETDFIIAFKDNGNNGHGTLINGSLIDGNIILYNSAVYYGGNCYDNVLTYLSYYHFLITFRTDAYFDKGTVIIGQLLNNTINFSDPSYFSEFKASDISVNKLNSTDFIISYVSDDVNGVAVFATTTVAFLSFSPPFPFSTSEVSGTSVVSISDSLAIISYTDEGNNGYGTSIAANVSLDTIIYSEPVVFNESGSFTTHGVKVSDSTFVLAFRNEGNGLAGSAVIGKVIVDETTGIDFNNYQNSIQVFPNPTNGVFTVEGDNITQIEISNLAGQILKVIKPFTGKSIIDLREFKSGIYLTKIQTVYGINTHKIILQ